MLIGKYGSETHRNWGHSNTFTKEDTFLAERLQKAGFRTVSVQAMGYFARGTGLERGFDVVDTSAIPAEGSIKEMENSVTGDRLTSAALKLLAMPEHTGKRFFFWTQLWVTTVALLMCAAVLTGAMTAPLLLALNFANGIGLALRWPVFAAIVPELVPRAQLPAALALIAWFTLAESPRFLVARPERHGELAAILNRLTPGGGIRCL